MQRVKFLWNAFKNVALLFSFIVNLVLVITLIIVVSLIFQIKNGIAEPLIDGLHGSFVGLDHATIDRIIPVRDRIPVQFTLPLEQATTVVLTSPVPLQANAQFVLPGGGGAINGTVNLQLPVGMELPVRLDMDVPVDTTIPVSLNVRAVIPIEETQLHDPIDNLRALLEPFVRALDNLPDNAGEAMDFIGRLLAGERPDLLAPTADSMNPWPGYAFPAGEGYVWPEDMPPQPGRSAAAPPVSQPPVEAPPAGAESAPPTTESGTGAAPAEETGGEAPMIETGPPPEGDLGIITPTTAP